MLAEVAKSANFMQSQTVSLGTLKKISSDIKGDDDRKDEQSPLLSYGKN